MPQVWPSCRKRGRIGRLRSQQSFGCRIRLLPVGDMQNCIYTILYIPKNLGNITFFLYVALNKTLKFGDFVMGQKFQNKYRIPSARAQWWDYGNNAAYFITICTANRKHYFGDIRNGKMELSSIGIIADIFWHEIIKHADFVKLGEFVVMPNHIHGILIVDKSDDAGVADMIVNPNTVTATTTNAVETRHALSLQYQYQRQRQPQSPQTPGQKRFQNQGKNTVSSIICGYKSAVTNHAHRFGYDFQWQSRFHDHIIKNYEEYQRIAKYIIKNPVNWRNDRFYIK